MLSSIKEKLDERSRTWRASWADDLDRPSSRRRAWRDMLLYDHGILRELYPNRHKIAEGVYRSSQPSPRAVRHLADMGIRSIVNLRGPSERGSYFLERETCEELGIELLDFRLSSTFPPSSERILEFGELFRRVERPVLMHCKSGADRAGLGAALYLLLVENAPVEAAQAQLSLRYLHVRQARTGVLDRIFSTYRRARDESGIGFEEWVRAEYDNEALLHDFRANGMIDRLTFDLAGRE